MYAFCLSRFSFPLFSMLPVDMLDDLEPISYDFSDSGLYIYIHIHTCTFYFLFKLEFLIILFPLLV
ncbi:hypothetical protein K435DRAFT_752964 [Dendrothele bispora CBS 962.96]|uniref:Uncharacterized protein n=1 Tax=Dendrothele bispora (strain CBS 962.96) TaxID=1314807 RepID=A0A4S8M825_DENBC|nr:hypothetical protein K435DRAFT_752964 [Dendrothele bispora CBS 962.96]